MIAIHEKSAHDRNQTNTIHIFMHEEIKFNYPKEQFKQ